MRRKNPFRVIVVALVLVFAFSAFAFAGDRAQEQMVIPDLLVGRPLGFLALGLGTLTYVVTLPVTIPFGWREDASRALVKKPYHWTFERGLGEGLKGY